MPNVLGPLILSALAVEGTAVVATIGSVTITAAQVATAVASVALSAGAAAIGAQQSSRAADPGAAQTVFRQDIPARRRFYGKNRVAGPLMLLEVRDGQQYNLYALCDGPIEAIDTLWLNGTIVSLDGSGGVQEFPYQGIEAPFSPIAFIDTQLGTDSQTALSRLTGALSDIWTSDHRLRGVATFLVVAGSVPPQSYLTVYPEGMPKGSAEGRYAKVYDARLDSTVPGGSGAHRIATPTTWAYSANSVCVLLDYLKHPDGAKIPLSYFDGALEEWRQQAAVCSESVPLKAGGTVSRWETHGGYSFDEPRKDVIRRMLDSFDGWLYLRADGKIGIRAGKLTTPTVTLTDEDIMAAADQRGENAISVANTIRASYVSPLHDYQRVEAEPWIVAADVALRGTKSASLSLDMVNNFSQARRLMKRAALRANSPLLLDLKTNVMGLQAFGERYIRVDSDALGIDATFEVLSASFETATMTASLSLRQVASNLDSWDATTEEGTPPPVVADASNESNGNAPVNLAATVIAGPALRISADAPPDTSWTFAPEYRREGDASWIPVIVAASTWTVDTSPLPPGTYSVRARFKKGGVLFPYATTINGISVNPAAPASPTAFTAVNASGTITLQATSPNDANHRALRFWRNSTNTFATATDLFGEIFTAPNIVTTRTNSPGTGTWFYWVTAEFSASARSSAVSAPSITI